jgi:hypothetical protein
MNTPRTRFFLASALQLTVIALSLAATGCATSGLGTLEGVIKDGHRASRREAQLVRIERAGGTAKTKRGMALMKADRIVTPQNVSVVIKFAGGSKVLVEPGSDLEILNPTVFVRQGVVIVLKLWKVRETLKVQTKYTIAAPEGTLFRTEVRGEEVTYKVVEGQLRVDSLQDTEPQVVFRDLQQGRVVGPELPDSVLPLDRSEAKKIRETLTVALKILRVAGLRVLLELLDNIIRD